MLIDRRVLLASATALMATGAHGQSKLAVTIYKTASCGCCEGWIKHMRVAGYAAKVVVVEDISALSAKKGVPFKYSSCHMGEAGGYVLLGHIPPRDVARLLKEKPKAIGLSVPGMPFGSPGMETPTGENEAYETLLLLAGGKTRVFARHA